MRGRAPAGRRRRQQPHPVRRDAAAPRSLAAGQYQSTSADASLREPLLARFKALVSSPRHCGAAKRSRAHEVRQASHRAAARRERTTTSTSASIRARRAAASERSGPCCVRGIDPDAALAPRHAQQAAVVHRVQQVGRGVRRAAPVVLAPCRARNGRPPRAGGPLPRSRTKSEKEPCPLPAFARARDWGRRRGRRYPSADACSACKGASRNRR